MFGNNVRPPGREHTLGLPRAFVAVRIIQLVLAVLVLGLDAYTLYVLPLTGAALAMFTTVVTLIVCVYHVVSEFGPAALYNYWAALALDIFLTVFWLISFALVASQVAPLFAYSSYYSSSYYDYYDYYYSYAYFPIAYLACMAAVAGIGGLLFCLFGITTVLTGLAIHRHRAAGGHCMPGRGGPASEKVGAPGGGAVAAPLPIYSGAPGPYAAPAPYGAPVQNQPAYGAPAGFVPQQQQQFVPQQQQQFVPQQQQQFVPQQQQQFAPVHPGQTMSPPPQHMYGTPPPLQGSPPLAQPQPVYGVPPQQQPSPSPIASQPTGGSFVAPQGPHHELPHEQLPHGPGSPQQLAGTPVQPTAPYQAPPPQ